MKPRKPTTWHDIYYRHIRAGDDPCYALWAADEWKRRAEAKAAGAANDAPKQETTS